MEASWFSDAVSRSEDGCRESAEDLRVIFGEYSHVENDILSIQRFLDVSRFLYSGVIRYATDVLQDYNWLKLKLEENARERMHICVFGNFGSIHFLDWGGVGRRNPMSMNVKSPSPLLIFFVKNVTHPPDKHGLWLDCATIPWSLTQMHLLAGITQPSIAYFSAKTVYPGPFR